MLLNLGGFRTMLLSRPTEKSGGAHLTDTGTLRAARAGGGSAGNPDACEVTACHFPARLLWEPLEHVTTDHLGSFCRMEGCSSASLSPSPIPIAG